ncbi:MAG: cation diffusion facilitator family transporter [Pseudomonadota bacterium]|nr:cation diffusion facilitator family transporter [Pseudomonadota bacterium]
MAADSLRSILYALGANLAIAAAKSAGAAYTGSASMLAEAIHSFADCVNQILLIWGLREARRAASAHYPLGHGRAIYFWSFIVSLMLFSMGGLFSIYEGVRKLDAHAPVKFAWVAVAILAFGVVAESFSLWGALREIDKDRGSRSLWQWFRVSRQSELLVILGEDLAALGGLALALLFILLSELTGNPVWDAIGSIGIGVLLVGVALVVGREVKSLLIGQSAEPEVDLQLRTHIEAQPEVAQVYHLITQQLGADLMLAVKARMHPAGSEVALIEAINAVERGLRTAFPQLRWVFFEPDLRD